MKLSELISLEWSRLRRDWIFWACTGFCSVLLAYGLKNGFDWMHFQQQSIQRAGQIEQEKREEARKKSAALDREQNDGEIDFWSDPRTAIGFEGAYLRLHDCLAPTPLAMVGIGQSDLLPYCVRITTGPWPIFLASYEWENPLRLLLGRVDCAFVLIYLMPLAILALSFNLFSRERELGTLSLLFANPLSPREWLSISFLLRAGLFLGIILIVLVLGLFAGGFDLSGTVALPRLIFWLGLIGSYGGFWFALAWLFNARGRDSAANALGLATIWLIFVIVLPGCLNLLVKQLYPLPSRVAFINALRETTVQSERQGSSLLQKYLYDHPELTRDHGKSEGDDFFSTLIAVNAETERVLAPDLRRFRSQSLAQNALIDQLAWLSPAIVFQQTANRLSGNDGARHRRFEEAVAAHRQKVKAFFDPKFVSEARFTEYDQVPRFDYQEFDFDSIARRSLFGILVLIFPTVLFALLGWHWLGRPIFEPR